MIPIICQMCGKDRVSYIIKESREYVCKECAKDFDGLPYTLVVIMRQKGSRVEH